MMRLTSHTASGLALAVFALSLHGCFFPEHGGENPNPRPIGNAEGFTGLIKPIGGGRTLTIQPDGKLVFAISSENIRASVRLVRYRPNLSLDTEFGEGGKVETPLLSGGGPGNAVVWHPDGYLLVTGYSPRTDARPKSHMAVARYDASGRLDHTFGSEGILHSSFVAPSGETETILSRGTSLAIQRDGKFLVAGSAARGRFHEFAMARYLSTGLIDASFGEEGVVLTNIASGDDRATAIAIQEDSKILLGGRANKGGEAEREQDDDFALVRYDGNGAIDRTFGRNGIVVTAISDKNDRVGDITLQKDGKIILTGRKGLDETRRAFILVRYDTTGALDRGFGDEGIVSTHIGVASKAMAALIQRDGKILAVGQTRVDHQQDDDFALARYHPNGSLDTDFGDKGTVITDLSPEDDTAYAVLVEGDGRIVAAGTANVADPSQPEEFALARYLPNGQFFESLILR